MHPRHRSSFPGHHAVYSESYCACHALYGMHCVRAATASEWFPMAPRSRLRALINSITREAAFFRLGFTPTPSSRSLFLESRRVTQFFIAVRLLSVYFGLAFRSIFAVRDCVTLESFLRFTPLLVTRDAIYERPLTCPIQKKFMYSFFPVRDTTV